MRLRELSISVAAILSLTAAPALAAGTGKGSAPTTHGSPKTTVSSPKATTTHGSPKTTTTSTHGSPKTTTQGGPKTTTHGSPKTTPTTHGNPKTTTTTHGSPKTTTTTTSHGNSKKTSTTTTAASGTTTTSGGTTAGETTTTTTTQLNPIAQKISGKTQLNGKVTSMLPTGISLNEASKGFKNQGQFIAALHVSQNLGIPFADLKEAMTGIRPVTTTTTTTGGTTTTSSTTTTTTTTSDSQTLLSLGQAIKKLRPGTDATSAESTATKQATADLSGK